MYLSKKILNIKTNSELAKVLQREGVMNLSRKIQFYHPQMLFARVNLFVENGPDFTHPFKFFDLPVSRWDGTKRLEKNRNTGMHAALKIK